MRNCIILTWAAWLLGTLALLLGLFRSGHAHSSPFVVSLIDIHNSDWYTGEFQPRGAYPLTDHATLPSSRIRTAGSWVGGDQWQGSAETPWSPVPTGPVQVYVAGYPRHPGCQIWAEFQGPSDGDVKVECKIADPGEVWMAWTISIPAEATSMRILAMDSTSDFQGWIAFSEPVTSRSPREGPVPYRAIVILTILALAVTWILRSRGKTADAGQAPSASSVSLRSRLLVVLALSGVVFFAQLWAISAWASDVPFWDQWDAEGAHLLVPWQQGTLTIEHILAPHNEHRIGLTRLTVLALTALVGVWDPRVEMLFNAFLHAATVAAAWWWLRDRFPSRRQTVMITLALGVATAVPYSWQNVTNGFNSQQYYLIAMSLFGINLTLRHPPFSPRWWLGVLCLTLNLFSMGSGFAAAAAVAVTLLGFERPIATILRKHGITLAVCAAIVLAGGLLHVDFEPHRQFKATSVAEFLHALVNLVKWPLPDFAPFVVLGYLPLALLAWVLVRTGTKDPEYRRDWVVMAVGLWTGAQLLATAYARGAGAPAPGSRYLDNLIIGLMVNFVSLLILLGRCRAQRRSIVPLSLLMASWCACVLVGLARQAHQLVRNDAPSVHRWYQDMTLNLARFISTQDSSWLTDRPIPFPDALLLTHYTEIPELRTLLPVSIRNALPVLVDNHAGFSEERISDHSPGFSYATYWSSHNVPADAPGEPKRWISQPVQPTDFGYLKFEVAGEYTPLHRNDVSLELWSVDLGTRLRTLALPILSATDPTHIYVRSPRQAFRIVATDQDADSWLAFNSPAAMPTLSYLGLRLAALGRPLLFLSIGLLVLACCSYVLGKKPAGAEGNPSGNVPTAA